MSSSQVPDHEIYDFLQTSEKCKLEAVNVNNTIIEKLYFLDAINGM